MRKYYYQLVDVFTDRPFGGNQLAVFLDARELTTETMQLIAAELKLSETTFVLPPKDPQNDYQVRIFTPVRELPMAGHPTIGTAYVLAREQGRRESGGRSVIQLEEGVGLIPVTIEWHNQRPGYIEMSQPLPTFGPRYDAVDRIAAMLSLDPAEIVSTDLPIEVVSCGVPFLFVPVAHLAAVRRIQFRLDIWEEVTRHFATRDIFVFTRETAHQGSLVHSRMFAPASGILEDPATGGAAGPLGCYLVKHGVIPSAPVVEFTSEQGIEMGRPSFIKVTIEQRDGQISGVRVGGQCCLMGAGYLVLE